MSLVFTDTLLSIFSRYISNIMITCNDKDAPWTTSVIKSAIRRNSRVYRKRVGVNLMTTTKSAKSKTQQIKLFVKLSAKYFEKLGGEAYKYASHF